MKDAYLIHVELGENLSYGVCYSVQLDYNIIKMNHELKMRQTTEHDSKDAEAHTKDCASLTASLCNKSNVIHAMSQV